MFWLGSSSANRLGQLPIIQFVILISQCNIEFEVNSSGRFSSFASHHQKNIRHNGVVDCVFMMLALLAVFYVRFINIDYLIEIFFLNCLLWLRLLSLFVSACVCVCVIRPVPADKRWSDCSNIKKTIITKSNMCETKKLLWVSRACHANNIFAKINQSVVVTKSSATSTSCMHWPCPTTISIGYKNLHASKQHRILHLRLCVIFFFFQFYQVRWIDRDNIPIYIHSHQLTTNMCVIQRFFVFFFMFCFL